VSEVQNHRNPPEGIEAFLDFRSEYGLWRDVHSREFLTGTVTAVFFALRIDSFIRHFHGYCDRHCRH